MELKVLNRPVKIVDGCVSTAFGYISSEVEVRLC